MKVVKNIIALALLASVAAPALAENVEVKVTGTIAPVACTPTISGGGVIDYGNISASALSTTGYTLLNEKQLDLAITCEAPVKMALKVTNGRPGTLAGNIETSTGFGDSPVNGIFGASSVNGIGMAGLGLANDKKIGGYAMRVDPYGITADGKRVDIVSRYDGRTWVKNTIGPLMSSINPLQVSWSSTGSTVPVAFSTMAAKVGVQAYINKASELDLSQPVVLDGLSTIEMVYL